MPLFGFGKQKQHAQAQDPVAVYEGLRTMILTTDPAKVGLAATSELPNVWGVVVDWGMDPNVATVVALADGTASMYTSTGGGVIGAGGRPAVDAANRRLLGVAEAQLARFEPIDAPADPDPTTFVYWILTWSGLRTAAHSPAGPPKDDAALVAVGEAFQEFVAQLRLASDRR
jgi:hypothetical protein